jgi:hypothetical protein
MKNKLTIDSRSGGFGDIWMRLIGFHAMKALVPISFHLQIPAPLRQLADSVFGERLTILFDEIDYPTGLTYTSLGVRDLMKGIIRGKKYIVPYHRSVIHDKKNKDIKDFVNIELFNIANFLGLVNLPDWKWITVYQGYLDIIGIDQLKNIDYNLFHEQILFDYAYLHEKLSQLKPVSTNLNIPSDIKTKIIVFPTGTGRQYIPVEWAKMYLPEACFAFFYRDKDLQLFQQNGLRTVTYYGPQDIIVLGNLAKWTITTDSFPSHLLQYSTTKCTILLTGTLKSRIISPAFRGPVIDAEAPCHPCVHLDRGNHPLCSAGFKECLNWSNKRYTNNILESIPSN